MPGRGIPIPTECVDANGRRLRLFNPAVRRGDELVGNHNLHFRPGELRTILQSAGSRAVSFRHRLDEVVGFWVAGALLFGGGATIPLLLGAQTKSMPVWCVPLLGAGLALIPAAALAGIVAGAYYVWGMVAFTGTSEQVVAAMLRARRCPSCAYPLAPSDIGALLVCTECGASWRE